VHLDQLVPERWRGLTRELAAFGTVGVVNLFVNFAVFNLLWLTVLRTGELKAKAIATLVATTCAYFMNRHWTYRDRPKSTLRREYGLFFVFNLIGLVIEVAVVGIAKYGLHQTHIVVLNACTAIGILLGTIFRFWAYRTHVFRVEPAVAVSADSAVGAVGPIGVGTVNGATSVGASSNGATSNGAASSGVSIAGITGTRFPSGSGSHNGPVKINGAAAKARVHAAESAELDEIDLESIALTDQPARVNAR
jgi:putative flippase GtrA